MGIAYFLILIVYVIVAVGVYHLVEKFTAKTWIKRLLIAFFILLPTYDIIITKALLFYYCNFTETEKVYRTVENPESVYIETDGTYSSYLNYPKQYILEHLVSKLQVKNENGFVSEFILANSTIQENPILIANATYKIQIKSEKLNSWLDHFIREKQIMIITDSKNNEILGEAISYIAQYPNIVPKAFQPPTMFDRCGTLLEFENKIFKFNRGVTNGNK